jgi:hypothetical protein
MVHLLAGPSVVNLVSIVYLGLTNARHAQEGLTATPVIASAVRVQTEPLRQQAGVSAVPLAITIAHMAQLAYHANLVPGVPRAQHSALLVA